MKEVVYISDSEQMKIKKFKIPGGGCGIGGALRLGLRI